VATSSATIEIDAADTPLPTGLRGYAALLRGNSDVRKVWTAQVISHLGNWFNTVALLGLITELTGNPATGNLIGVAQIVPVAFAGLFLSGVVADRFNRKTVMMVADLTRAVIALSFLWVRTPETAWIAYAGTVALALGTAFYQPAASAALPNVVSQRELPAAAMLGQTTFATMLFVGAFLGGAITTLLGRDVAFVLNALSFVGSALLIWRTRANFNSQLGKHSLTGVGTLRVLTEGVRYLRENATVRTYVLAKPAAAWALGGFGLFSTYSIAIYGSGDWGTSLLYAGRGIGAFISPLLVSGLVSVQQPRTLNRFIRAGMLMVIAGYALFALTTSPYVGMLCAGIAHWGNAWAMTLSGLVVQSKTPDYVRGRVLALDSVGWSLTSSLSNLLVGFLAVQFSPQVGVLVAAALTGVCVGLWWMGSQRAQLFEPPTMPASQAAHTPPQP
jgi:MFS family permease